MFKSNSSFVNIHVKVNCFSLVYHVKYIINLYIHKKTCSNQTQAL